MLWGATIRALTVPPRWPFAAKQGTVVLSELELRSGSRITIDPSGCSKTMSTAPLPADESIRLAALRRYGVLDSPPEAGFDDLVGLAAQICGTPIALITLVDEQRQWFKARIGFDLSEAPRTVAFCAHALHGTDLFTVPDTALDDRFADNPLVIGEPHIRFYAGAPLLTPEGQALGTLCVIDRQPRQLTAEQQLALRVLGRQAVALLEQRRLAQELAALQERTAPPDGPQVPTRGSGRSVAIMFWITLFALMLIALNSGRSLLDAQSLATQRLQVRQLLLESKDLLLALQSTEIGQRNYLLRADQASVQAYDAGVAEVGQRLASIERLSLAPDSPAYDLRSLRVLIAAQLAELDSAVQAHRRDRSAQALQIVLRGRDSRLSSDTKAMVGNQILAIERALDERVRRGNDHIALTLSWLVAGTLASATALLTGFTWLRRKVRQRDLAVSSLAQSSQSTERQVADRTASLLAANAALRASEAFLRSVGDNLPGGVIYQILMDADDRPHFRYISAGVERLHGLTVQAVLDNPAALLDQILEEDRPAWLAERAEAYRAGRAFSFDARIRRADGQERWVHLTSSRRSLADGRSLIDGVELDITERKRAEADHAQLLERLSDGIFSLDSQWQFTYVNQRTAEVFDRPQKALLGKNIWTEFPPFVRTQFYTACHRAVSQQRLVLSQDHNPAIDRWFETRIYPSRDGVLIFAGDVTESKRAERALRESDARVQLALEASNIGLWEWKYRSNEAYLSPILKRQLGYADHEVGDRTDVWVDWVHPDDLASLQTRLAESLRTPWPRYENEYRLRHKDGSYRWIKATGSMLLDAEGRPLRMLGTQQDITETRQAQAERERLLTDQVQARADANTANDRLALVLESVSDAFFALDREWRFVFVNGRAAQTFGRSSAELLGRHIWTEFPAAMSQAVYRAYHEAMDQRRFVYLEDNYAPVERWFENRIYPSEEGISVFFHDVSDRKRAEAALRTTEAQLHELLGQLQRAQEAERIRIARWVHDELGQLLTSVKMDLRWLERKLGEPGVPLRFNGLLDRTVAASELNDLTIATVQRIAAELRPPALDQLGLAAALAQAARHFQQHSGVTCSVDVALVEPMLPADVASELFYICQEALTNVARHAQATEVEISLHSRDDEVVLEVRDNGVGIDPALIDGRHSLGLLGMRERALQCHGIVQILRGEPRGTRVSVRVPLTATVEGIEA